MAGQRGATLLDWLHRNAHSLACVYVPSESASLAPLTKQCQDLGLACEAIGDPNDDRFLERFRQAQPRLTIIAGYPTIFGRSLLETPELGTINLHAGRVPQYRGGSPLNWQMANGEADAGISVLRVGEGIDDGHILAEALLPIGPDDDIASLHERVNAAFPKLVGNVLGALAAGDVLGRSQNPSEARYWHQRNDDDGRIFWERRDAQAAHDLVRAVTRPYPGAFSYLDGRKVRIFRSSLPDMVIRGVPGRVCYVSKMGPYIVCRDRAILVHEYVFEDHGEDRRMAHGSRLH